MLQNIRLQEEVALHSIFFVVSQAGVTVPQWGGPDHLNRCGSLPCGIVGGVALTLALFYVLVYSIIVYWEYTGLMNIGLIYPEFQDT